MAWLFRLLLRAWSSLRDVDDRIALRRSSSRVFK